MIGCFFGLLFGMGTPECANWHRHYQTQKVQRQDITVIDGDTITWKQTTRVRLMGFDTPELSGRCNLERRLAQDAKGKLHSLLAAATDIELVNRSERDQYGRLLAWLMIDGRDVGRVLISERLARPYDGGQRMAWC